MSRNYDRSRNLAPNTFRKSSIAEAISATLIATMISSPVFATEQEEEEIEVIMVTATKKNESIQEVPLAVTALTGDFIEKVRLTDVKDIIAYSPGVNGNASNSFLDSVSVRGVRTDDYGAGGDGSLGFFKNDQFEGRTGSAVSTLFDMDRAEIVNGPQGFLFGRNAIGGAVSVHTKRALIDEFEANLDVDVGDYSLVKINGAVNVPVSDNFAMRFAGVYHNEESYTDNMNGIPLQDIDVSAVRWSTTFQKDDLAIYTMAEFEDRSYPAGQYRFIEEGEIWDEYDALWGTPSRGGERDIDTNSYWGLRDEAEVLNLQLRVEQGFDFADLTMNMGYKDYDYWYSEQWIPSRLENGSWAVDQSGDYTQAELRLSSKPNGPLSWYVGASAYEENLEFDTLNSMSEEFNCAYYNSIYSAYYAGYFDSLSGAQTGHCQNFVNNLDAYWGAYYGPGYFDYITDFNNPDGQVQEVSAIDAKNTGWAVYASVGYQITETVDIEVGVRHTEDKKEFANMFTSTGFTIGNFYNVSNSSAEPITRENTWDDTSYKFLVRWKPAEDMMLYASYTEGYKSGGFTSYAMEDHNGDSIWGAADVTNADAEIPMFDPEYVESYEIGYKDTWFDYTDVRFTAYMYDYFGLQVTMRDEGGAVIIENIGSLESFGLEGATTTNIGENWNFMMNFHYIDSESYGVQDECNDTDACEGNKIYWAPEFSGAMVLDGLFPLDSGAAITVSIESYWESEHGGGYTEVDEAIIDDSQTWNFRLGYQAQKDWYVEAYVDNVLDETNFDSSYLGNYSYDGQGGGAYPAVVWASTKPRSYGLRFGMSWD